MHIETALCKVDKGVSTIKTLRRKSLLTTYKAFLRPPNDYDDLIYDQLSNESFCEKLDQSNMKLH